MTRRRRPAFTLVEILVAFFVLVLFTVGVFTILRNFSRAGSIGQWRSFTNGQIRKAQERLRQHIEGASYPMKITPQANQISDIPAHYVIVNPEGSGAADDNTTEVVRVFGPGDDAAEPSGEEVLLQLVKSKPGREGLGSSGSLADKPVEATMVKFLLKGKNKVFGPKGKWNRTLYIVEETASAATTGFTSGVPFNFAGGTRSETLILNDVNRVRVAAPKDSFPSGTVSVSPVPLEVQLFCVEPGAGQAELISTVQAHPNSGVELK
ncbi:MAG: prepilin-type N-terminal cleavage/methylation domain-containing protein [Candidatus Wallbacteria bacterium]|nr:prepilin-type N-terminal cleavage/methylation domain-containing protein [Candidatus Wallbacteria bacterium]